MVDKGSPLPGRPLVVMLMRVVMVIAVKPVIKAMSFVWLERERKRG